MPGIIVGVDGFDHSSHALRWATREAVLRHAPLTVMRLFTLARDAGAGDKGEGIRRLGRGGAK